MSEFLVYLRLGFEHITDPGGLDHLLFVAALTATDVDRPRRLFWLVTAFTLGHSLSLALATLGFLRIGTSLVELLIPTTILATCALNFRAGESDRSRYLVATGFGLVHGLGFSSFLRAALGSEESILRPLFAFNVGLEVGQLVLVAGLVLAFALLVRVLPMPRRTWTLGVSGVAALAALLMVIERL